jgi:hypothetical protein
MPATHSFSPAAKARSFFTRRRCGASVEIKGDARVGYGELDAGKMNHVAPNQERRAVRNRELLATVEAPVGVRTAQFTI